MVRDVVKLSMLGLPKIPKHCGWLKQLNDRHCNLPQEFHYASSLSTHRVTFQKYLRSHFPNEKFDFQNSSTLNKAKKDYILKLINVAFYVLCRQRSASFRILSGLVPLMEKNK